MHNTEKSYVVSACKSSKIHCCHNVQYMHLPKYPAVLPPMSSHHILVVPHDLRDSKCCTVLLGILDMSSADSEHRPPSSHLTTSAAGIRTSETGSMEQCSMQAQLLLQQYNFVPMLVFDVLK